MSYKSLLNHNIMELWLFDTCNFRCGYCGLVTNGDVLKTEQLDVYRDPAYIDRLVRFFGDHRPGGRPWVLMLTGGEPTLMPNLDRFITALGKQGDTVGLHSNMSAPINKVLSQEGIDHLSYIQASFHPDWHMGRFERDRFFENVALAKSLGASVLVRFVGAPQVLHLLPELEEQCRNVGVTMLPTTLFNPEYPREYTTEEKAKLTEYMVGYSSLVQLEGGIVMKGRKCLAGDRIFAARLHQGGDVTPCISTDKPVLGNVFENTLKMLPGMKGCFRADQMCTCDVHFQQGIVEGVDDSEEYALILAGKGVRRAADYEAWKRQNQIETSTAQYSGMGVSLITKDELLRKATRPGRGGDPI